VEFGQNEKKKVEGLKEESRKKSPKKKRNPRREA
jgi:hypothetical protein